MPSSPSFFLFVVFTVVKAGVFLDNEEGVMGWANVTHKPGARLYQSFIALRRAKGTGEIFR